MNKNKLMLVLTTTVVLISLLVQALHHFEIIIPMHGPIHFPDYYNFVSVIIAGIPILLLAGTFFCFLRKKDHRLVPLLVTLTLTFASISTISGGAGMVEYHFALFMAVAILAYYEKIQLILLMTGIFVLQHVLGFIIPAFTVFVFGVHEYTFTMILIHAIFLGITAGATIWQIHAKQKHVALLQAENEKNTSTINEMIGQLKNTSEKVLDTVHHLNDSAQESQVMSSEITATIQQMATGADNQRNMANDSEALLEEMTKDVEQIATSASFVVEASSQTTEEANQGKSTVQKTIHQIDTISHAFDELSNVVTNLEKRSFEITEIISVISEISAQTNLLALNAAIEAARAGESGKGFAVVADEVRKLAEQSEQSVEKVGNLVREIQADTDSATKSMQSGSIEVKEGISLANQTGDLFERIIVATEDVYKQIHETAAISEQLSAGSDQVLTSVKEMTNVAQQTATSSDHVAKVSEKQVKSVDNINVIANSLNNLVDELNALTLGLSRKP